MLLRQFTRFALVSLLVFSVAPLHGCGDEDKPSAPDQESQSCNAGDNPNEIAQDFIGRCRKGSIYREFPTEYLGYTLGEIQAEPSANARKAWKLLNDGRFRK